MKISDNGLALIRHSEGFAAHVYDDNGKPAIGYGHDLLPGESFPEGVTQAQATALLLSDVSKVEDWLNSQPFALTCTQGQFDALCDFGFNLGLGSLKQMLSHGWDAVPVQLVRWTHIGQKTDVGLTARRNSELQLWKG